MCQATRISLFSYTRAKVWEQYGNDLQTLTRYTADVAATNFGVTVRRSLSNTESEASFDTARGWLQNCVNTHDCSMPISLKDQEHTPAARLLDLHAFPEPDLDVRLVDNNDETQKYATLSYCWGQSRAYTTTTRSFRLRQARIDYRSLPKTFRDAILITRKLNIRYLWIDACCIIQDSVADWQSESAKMGYIYSNSFVTIAADSGTDSSSGCFNEGSTSQELSVENTPFELITRTDDGQVSSVYLWDPSRGSRRPTPPEVDGSPLSERGWVCQERILSARILHYTKSQLFWECRQCLLAEDGFRPWSLWADAETVPGLARNLYGTTADTFSLNRLLDIWYQNVISQSYSRRKLTRAEDKLTAISGLARAFHRHFRSKYIAGLWELDLAFAICWRRRGPVRRPAVYRAPTFSWACVDALIEWPLRSTVKALDLTIQKVDVQCDSSDIFGKVSTCSLDVKTRLKSAMVTSRKRISSNGVDLTWELRTHSNKLLGTAFMDSDDVDDGSTRVDCMILDKKGKGQAVLLEQVSENSDKYFRIGVAELLGLDDDDDFFATATERSIRLI